MLALAMVRIENFLQSNYLIYFCVRSLYDVCLINIIPAY